MLVDLAVIAVAVAAGLAAGRALCVGAVAIAAIVAVGCYCDDCDRGGMPIWDCGRDVVRHGIGCGFSSY